MRGYEKNVCFVLSYFLRIRGSRLGVWNHLYLKDFFGWLCVIHGTRGGTWQRVAVRCSSLRYEGVRDNLLSRGSYVYSRYVAFTWRYVDITCHCVVLRGYYVADTIKFYEGLTQRFVLTRCSANATGLITRPAVYVAFTAPKIFIFKICLTLLIRGSFTQRCDHGIKFLVCN